MRTKKPPERVAFLSVLLGLEQRILVYKTHAQGQVTSSNQPTAWFTNLVFGNLDTVTSFAAVGIYSKTMLANA